ncbi:hypothetical protein ACRALDRAFT_1083402 [Sodiomyces alcalophilus JCM 7366]|uniref:uncharacterized protein n=1 Tax=Sodiomyces alcalophilus JCM 7366 TaxID=591952 RepID=UPI0039B40E9C
MSVIQNEELVTYQLRCGYLTEIADGVGERLISLNEGFLNSPAFKAVGWQANPDLAKRCYSPPIPTAIASEYFQGPRPAGVSLEEERDEGGMLTGGGTDTFGPGLAIKRRRRAHTNSDDDDSSDLSDESDDDDHSQRAAQQIKFSKMPVRPRAGSSPIQSSNLRQVSTVSSPRAAPGARRGSHSALEVVKERARRDTVTSSEVSSENEFDSSAFYRHRDAARAAAKTVRLEARINEEPGEGGGAKRAGSDLLHDDEDDSDASDMSGDFIESIDSTGILDAVEHSNQAPTDRQVVGTPPRQFTRRSTIRKSQAPPRVLEALPPPRPMSMIRPVSVVQPKGLLSAAFDSKKTKPTVPFEKFASLSGQGEKNPIAVHIYPAFSDDPEEPFEVLIRRTVHHGQGGDRPVTVADLIGLSLWRYMGEKREPPIPEDKQNINWWTLRMVEEDGEVDDDFPPFDRAKALTSFTTANNRAAGRMRANSKTHDNFGLVQATQAEFIHNQSVTPQEDADTATTDDAADRDADDDATPRKAPQPTRAVSPGPMGPRPNPVTNTTYRQNATIYADAPQIPATTTNTSRGQKKLLRVHLHAPDIAPGQLVTLDVTTETYMAEVLDLVCRKRQLDKDNHVLRMPGRGPVVLLDAKVQTIGSLTDLELHRRRFATDGPLVMSSGGSPSSASPKLLPFGDGSVGRRGRKLHMMGSHPLSREAMKQAELTGMYKSWTVWRLRTVRMRNQSERLLEINGDYLHIKPTSRDGKTTTVHMSQIIGCKTFSKHPDQFKLIIYKGTEVKRYDFEAKNATEANEMVEELRKMIIL